MFVKFMDMSDRRDFIKKTALAGVGLGIAGNGLALYHSPGRKTGSSTGKRIGMVGLDTGHSEAFTKSFDLVMGMTGGGPGGQTEVVAVQIYQQAFLGQFQTGRASAYAYIVLIIVIAISNLYIRNLNSLKEG